MERIRTLSRPHGQPRVRSGNAGANNKAIVICGDRSTLYFEHTKLNIHLNQTVRELSNESRSIVVEGTELTDSISTSPAPQVPWYFARSRRPYWMLWYANMY